MDLAFHSVSFLLNWVVGCSVSRPSWQFMFSEFPLIFCFWPLHPASFTSSGTPAGPRPVKYKESIQGCISVLFSYLIGSVRRLMQGMKPFFTAWIAVKILYFQALSWSSLSKISHVQGFVNNFFNFLKLFFQEDFAVSAHGHFGHPSEV